MKNSTKLFALAIALLVSTFSYAAGTKEKVIAKATAVVENGAPDDWMLLAKQADYLIRKNAGLTIAKEWIEKSVTIKADAYNVEIMGDYYAKNNLPRQAIDYYIQSMDLVKEGKPDADTSSLQNKIVFNKGQI